MRINWENWGIAASLACAIHCALTPLFFTSLPLMGVQILEHPAVEFGLLGLALVIGLLSLRHGYKLHHHRLLPILLFLAGIALMFVKELVPGGHWWLLLPAVILILSAHVANHLLCRKANHCHSTDCSH
ncbi:MAG TPA: MerC domain-containing protein [Phnomibacter sp.]|nr:MerC domain-containing protein [Phnomibacter sp.]